MLTFDQIKELANLVADKKLEAIELERAGFRLQILGRGAPAPIAVAAPAPLAEAVPALPRSETTESEPAPAARDEADNAHVVHSPIVGTFYSAPSPDADPFVQVGDRVKKGQVVCIVEAMKLMNEIESDADGVVVKVFPQNAQPVEYGEPLFAIRLD